MKTTPAADTTAVRIAGHATEVNVRSAPAPKVRAAANRPMSNVSSRGAITRSTTAMLKYAWAAIMAASETCRRVGSNAMNPAATTTDGRKNPTDANARTTPRPRNWWRPMNHVNGSASAKVAITLASACHNENQAMRQVDWRVSTREMSLASTCAVSSTTTGKSRKIANQTSAGIAARSERLLTATRRH